MADATSFNFQKQSRKYFMNIDQSEKRDLKNWPDMIKTDSVNCFVSFKSVPVWGENMKLLTVCIGLNHHLFKYKKCLYSKWDFFYHKKFYRFSASILKSSNVIKKHKILNPIYLYLTSFVYSLHFLSNINRKKTHFPISLFPRINRH